MLLLMMMASQKKNNIFKLQQLPSNAQVYFPYLSERRSNSYVEVDTRMIRVFTL